MLMPARNFVRAFVSAFALPLALLPGLALTSVPAFAKTIVETTEDSGSFTVLNKLIKAAGLADALDGPGPFTVFAPTDDAFGKLPKAALEALYKPENKDKLKAILATHVISGLAMSKDFAGKRLEGTSVEGTVLLVNATRAPMVEDAHVMKTDMVADNGVIHVIDTVLLPR